MTEVAYGFTRTMQGVSGQTARLRLEAALRAQGFGVATDIEVKAGLRARLNSDFPNYVIVGECRAVTDGPTPHADPGKGLLLPCNVVVTEGDDNDVMVSILDPESVLRLLHDPSRLREPMRMARVRLQRALDRA